MWTLWTIALSAPAFLSSPLAHTTAVPEDNVVMLRLEDVHPLQGGYNIVVLDSGTALCQVVGRKEDVPGLYEKRYRTDVSSESMRQLTRASIAAVAAEPQRPRPGLADEPRPIITAVFRSGKSMRLVKWAHDRYPPFDEIYAGLLSEVERAQRGSPIYEGPYDAHWLPHPP
jgi:hypothetical protein